MDEIPQAKRREGLIRDKEQILISEKLVTLDKTAPVDKDFSKFKQEKRKLFTFFFFEIKMPSYLVFYFFR